MQISDLILEKNNQYIAFNKPGNMPVQEDKTEDKSLANIASAYAKKTVFVVHRIDRPASGVVVFAKTKGAVQHMNEQLRNRSVKKIYLAIVKNKPEKEADNLVHFLLKNQKSNKTSIVTEDKKGAKRAELKYKVINKSDNYFLLEIELITGRHHQIRAQLAAIGCPIKGDVKYGARRSNKNRSIHLHAWKMAFAHPVTEENVEIIAPVPSDDPVWAAMAV